MKLKQKNISQSLGISDAFVSMILNKKRPISWPLAARLSEMFPGKTTQQWKNASPEDLLRAFAHLADTQSGGEAA